MTRIRDLELAPASVEDTATFATAAAEMSQTGLPALAVLSADGKVAGVFSEDDLLRGLFPGYLGELHHTAFLGDDESRLQARAAASSGDPVGKHVTKAPMLELDDSATHAAELFLHSGLGALPVVDRGRFAGMLLQRTLAADACRRMAG